MDKSSSPAGAYRRLGCLALAHAGALLALTPFCLASRATDEPGFWLLPLWVGLVTLWFFWPVVLVLHHGQSAMRLAVFALLSAILLGPSLRSYSEEAPWTFGFPPGVTLDPSSAWQYFSAYREGRAQAQKDIAAGILAIEEYGLPDPGLTHYVRIMRERNQVEVRRVAGCIVDERILGHEAGYNSVSKPEIDRRIGPGRVEAAREEGNQAAAKQRALAEQAIKDLTRRLTTLPPEGKVTTESVSPYVDQQPLDNPGDVEELRALVREIETCVAKSIPEDAPAFKLNVTVRSPSGEKPTFEISSPGFFPPDAIFLQTIDKNLQAAAFPTWNRGYLYLALDFAIRTPRQ